MNHITNIKSIVRGIGVFTALSLAASFCNFLFNFVLIRLLSSQEFRDLTLANNMINVFGNLFIALNIVSIAIFYISKDKQADIIRACQKIIYVLYALLLIACVAFNSEVQRRTGLHDTLILNLTLAVIFFSIPVMVLNAIYLGSNRFNKSAVLNICLALGRLILGVAGAIIIATHKDVAAVGGVLLVYLVVFSFFTLLEKEEYRKKNFEIFKRIWEAPVHILKQHRLLVAASVLYAVTINFLFGLDLFMFGQFFSNSDSADYAAVSIVGKLIFYVVAPVSVYLAAKQQELIHTKPRTALRASIGVNTLTILGGLVLAAIPTSIIGLLIHRGASDINHEFLLLSLVFNTAVVLTNHQVIEAIVGKRQKTALTILGSLLLINGSLFMVFRGIESTFSGHTPALLALGIPAVTMVTASTILFTATHLVGRKKSTAL
jgi:O-antigen/teichoic acid export membrane protein